MAKAKNKNIAAVEKTAAVNTETTGTVDTVAENTVQTQTEETSENTETTGTVDTVAENTVETQTEEISDNTETTKEVGDVSIINVQDAEIIPSGVFISESGEEYEFTVAKFLFKGKKYQVQEAIANHEDVLEELAALNSFILKRK